MNRIATAADHHAELTAGHPVTFFAEDLTRGHRFDVLGSPQPDGRCPRGRLAFERTPAATLIVTGIRTRDRTAAADGDDEQRRASPAVRHLP
ncbi:hypothetical protein [Streptomyces sp. AGS-58]|uniref:hypothetical protein n=1 Tax=unclassified Streptomyces TaxID=2593676 RepID=UPI0035A2A1F2